MLRLSVGVPPTRDTYCRSILCSGAEMKLRLYVAVPGPMMPVPCRLPSMYSCALEPSDVSESV